MINTQKTVTVTVLEVAEMIKAEIKRSKIGNRQLDNNLGSR